MEEVQSVVPVEVLVVAQTLHGSVEVGVLLDIQRRRARIRGDDAGPLRVMHADILDPVVVRPGVTEGTADLEGVATHVHHVVAGERPVVVGDEPAPVLED